ncbi:hypothetical protein ACS0TY_002988 [Phlomoides rotata]
MALRIAITRRLFLSKSRTPSSFNALTRLFLFNSSSATKISETSCPFFPQTTSFCTSSQPKKINPKLVNFSLPSDSDDESPPQSTKTKEVDKTKLPPPYNPFDKKPALEEPDDPMNLQEVFAKIREDGLMNSAVKMFDGLSKDGLTHEALELFSQIKDKGNMPDVIAHTAVIEAYVNAGKAKEAHKVYLRMLVSGVLPNAYTYSVLIRGLAESGDVKLVKEAGKYVGEMVARGMRPNAATCVKVFVGLAKVGAEDEATAMLEMLKEKGVVPEQNEVRNAIKNSSGLHNDNGRTLINILYGK